jgi:hypothetical protein
LLVVSTHVLLQIVSEPGHDGTQLPPVQLTLPLAGALQVVQFGPQLLMSVLSAHFAVEPHSCSPELHETPQTPAVQVAFPPPVTVGQALLHVLQLRGSVWVLVHVEPQRFGVAPEQLLSHPYVSPASPLCPQSEVLPEHMLLQLPQVIARDSG